MTRFVAFLTLLALAWTSGVDDTRAMSLVSLLLDRPQESLRGEAVDLDDPWDSARLLAHFGEDCAAYDLLRRRPRLESMNLELERFEARLLTEMGLYDRADSLLALRPYAADPRERCLHYLWRAELNTMCGRYERALDLIGCAAGSQDTVFEPYRDLVTVEALLRTHRPLEAGEAAEKRLARGAPPSLTIEFETRLLEAYLHAGRTAEALKFLQAVKTRTTGRSASAPLAVREVDVRFMMGDTRGAVDAAVELVDTHGTAIVTGAVDSVLSRVPIEDLMSEALLAFGGFLLRHGRVTDADRLVTGLAARKLDGTQKEQTRLLHAEVLYKQKRYTAADDRVRTVFADPAAERKAKLLRARIYRGAGQRVKSAEAYELFARAFPYDSKAPEALYVAWDMQREAGDPAIAAGILTTIVETYPSHKYSRLATLRIAFDHVERREYARGARTLEEALERGGREDPAFLHYLADIYARMGNHEKRTKLVDELAALDPVSFYLNPQIPPQGYWPAALFEAPTDSTGAKGLLGFLKRVVQLREDAYQRVRDHLEPWEDWPASEEAAGCLMRGRVFVEMGLRGWAEAEFRTAESSGGRPAHADLALGMLYDDFGMPWKSVRAFQRVYYSLGKDKRRRLDRDFKLLTYPVPYPLLVLENCSRDGVAPHLVYAMIREESRFDEKAVSSAGAMGLMQIMPATGEQLAEELGLPEGVHKNLLSPDINLSFGVFYAARLLELSDRYPLKMLAAYNAGFSNATRWFNDGNAGKSPVERVDAIDFWETREYVKRIVESTHVYYSIYFSPAAATGGPSPPREPDRPGARRD